MTKSQSDSARTWVAKLDLIEEKIEPVVSNRFSLKLDRIETSSRVSVENSVHSAKSLDSVSSMVSQIYSTISKWDSVNSSAHHDIPSAKFGPADNVASSENATSASLVATKENRKAVARNATYRCYYPGCYQGEMRWSHFDRLHRHLVMMHETEVEEFALLTRLQV